MFNNVYFRKPCRLWDVEKHRRAGHATDACVNMLDNQGCARAHTHKICNTYCFSTATMVTRTCLNVTLHIHCPSCQCLWNFPVEWVELEFRNQKGASSHIGPDTVFLTSVSSLPFIAFGKYHDSTSKRPPTTPPPEGGGSSTFTYSLIIWSCII